MKLFYMYRSRTKEIYKKNNSLFIDKKGIEIGGPSGVFKKTGPFPIYDTIGSLDNINFSDDNFWSNLKEGKSFIYETDKPPGEQIIADAIDLSKITPMM
jgi:hypothetical protein